MRENTTDTPITDKCRQQMAEKGWTNNQPVWGLLFNMGDIERQLAEARKSSVCIHGGIAASAHGWALKFQEASEVIDSLSKAADKLEEDKEYNARLCEQWERDHGKAIDQRDMFAEALRKIERRTVIAGSVDEYRRGQIDSLSACRSVASEALAILERKEEG